MSKFDAEIYDPQAAGEGYRWELFRDVMIPVASGVARSRAHAKFQIRVARIRANRSSDTHEGEEGHA